jgi:hypothetical protein
VCVCEFLKERLKRVWLTLTSESRVHSLGGLLSVCTLRKGALVRVVDGVGGCTSSHGCMAGRCSPVNSWEIGALFPPALLLALPLCRSAALPLCRSAAKEESSDGPHCLCPRAQRSGEDTCLTLPRFPLLAPHSHIPSLSLARSSFPYSLAFPRFPSLSLARSSFPYSLACARARRRRAGFAGVGWPSRSARTVR